MIMTDHTQDEDRACLFPDNEIVFTIREDNPNIKNIFDILVLMGAFKSKTQAKKNWKGGQIQPGWNEWFIGKFKKHLCIWNPFC